MRYYCSVCKETINKDDYKCSMANIGIALCMQHQKVVTPQAVKLSKALKNLHIEHILEYFDGFKHIDLAILNAKVYIELDGSQHAFTPQQVCIDDDRDQFSVRDGFVTKRYPNSYIDSDVDKVALGIALLVNKRRSDLLDEEQTQTILRAQVVTQPKQNISQSQVVGKKEKPKRKKLMSRFKNAVVNVSEKLENFE